ncbi:MAG TPA: YhgE/Pip domain-containing protein [Slackia equolifaciens]|uniref:YhgE/Pip domain-containing protein n=1 Tax=Slackia equolifaciens TaxID=498718 RepID=A0A9D3A2J5_9ACTN|nr:YhgE/Pip domain-containing protein [Slackia equolifaciens]
MKNIWRLFVGDLKRMGSNVVTVIIVLGLVALPSIFSWYNIIACWNVFNNTGNLTVAVANSDEGYQSDLVPIRVNIGDQVVSALRANDQMKWEFTDEEDAIDGAKSGKYYAAVVIPKSFSRDMMTFYTGDAQHASIVYYTNEKKNAIAPKVTDQGADQISTQVNRVFAETLSEAALGISSSLMDYLDSADASGAIAKLGDRVGSVGEQMTQASQVLRTYSQVMGTAGALVEDSGDLIAQARASAGDVASEAGEAKDAAGTVTGALDDATGALSSAIEQSSAGYGAVADSVDAAFDSAGALASDSADQLRSQASAIDSQIANYQDLAAQLETIKANLPEEDQAAVDAVIARLNSSIELQGQLRDSLNSAADSIEAGSSDTQAKRDEVKQLAAQAQESLAGAKADYDSNLKPTLQQLASDVGDASTSLAAIGSQLDAAAGDLTGATDSVAGKVDAAQQGLDDAADQMEESGANLTELSQDISKALASNDTEALRKVIGSDPSALATALSAPVQLDRHAVYPVENFGSAMAPLYTTLALWIGALLIMVALKVNPSQRTLEGLDNPTPRQLFIGRFGVVAVISLMQSTCVCLGNLFFLRVQANEPLLYLLIFWVAGLVFAFIIYTLVASFANFGKALSVFLLIIQVSGGGGSYPLQLLPQFVQDVSPYLPITHAVNAMRAAQFGVYQGDFWVQLGTLVLFVLPFIVLGLVLRNPLIKLVGKFVEKVESTKVM